jgi:hypothetical protein
MSRYQTTSDFPQPIRKIIQSSSDIEHVLIMGERIDNIANKYYSDPLLGWVIMCANPEFDNEFDIKPGDKIRIPYPLQRVFDQWKVENDL